VRFLYAVYSYWSCGNRAKKKKAIEDPYKKRRLLNNLIEFGCNRPVIIKIVSIWQVTKKITIKKIPFRIHYHSTPKKISLKKSARMNALDKTFSANHFQGKDVLGGNAHNLNDDDIGGRKHL